VRNAQGAADSGAAARAWTGIWKTLDLEHTLTPIDLQRLKPEIHTDTLKMLLDGSGADRILAGEYGKPHVVVAIAEPDAATKRLDVTLAGMDAVGPLHLKRSYRVFDGDTGYTMELAAVVSQRVLEGRWKALRSGIGSAAHGAQIAVQARYTSLAEWRDMRRQLLDMPGVNDLRIEAESAQGANLTLRYPGGPDKLAAALYSRGLSLQGGVTGWVLRSGN
jgi:hypothetical protein